jgi:hemerythrin-like domain-containing protein
VRIAMDAIAVLKKDHQEAESLFKGFERTPKKQKRSRKRIAKKIVEELSRHADLEEQIFYPAVQEATKKDEQVFKALEEHELVKKLMEELEKMEPDQERFEAKVVVLIDQVRAHVKEEERVLFPMVRRALKPPQLKDLGERLEEGKKALRKPTTYLKKK